MRHCCKASRQVASSTWSVRACPARQLAPTAPPAAPPVRRLFWRPSSCSLGSRMNASGMLPVRALLDQSMPCSDGISQPAGSGPLRLQLLACMFLRLGSTQLAGRLPPMGLFARYSRRRPEEGKQQLMCDRCAGTAGCQQQDSGSSSATGGSGGNSAGGGGDGGSRRAHCRAGSSWRAAARRAGWGWARQGCPAPAFEGGRAGPSRWARVLCPPGRTRRSVICGEAGAGGWLRGSLRMPRQQARQRSALQQHGSAQTQAAAGCLQAHSHISSTQRFVQLRSRGGARAGAGQGFRWLPSAMERTPLRHQRFAAAFAASFLVRALATRTDTH